LKNLLIGSEGILGIITAATIQVFPLPREKTVIWASFKNFNDVLDFYLQTINNFNDSITSFEFMNKTSIEILEKNEMKLDNLKKNECYCLVEISNTIGIKDFQNFITSNINFEKLKTDDLIISKSEFENKKLWSYRESIPLAERKENFIIPHDISIPITEIEKFVYETTVEIKKFENNFKIINFGHLGDNNLHFNVLVNNNCSKPKKIIIHTINRIVFSNVNKFGGAISAEHGIGQLRVKELRNHKTKEEIKKMKMIKKIFDPNNILNPGKVI
jgi:FAD/FMN-containing dehydrogenase